MRELKGRGVRQIPTLQCPECYVSTPARISEIFVDHMEGVFRRAQSTCASVLEKIRGVNRDLFVMGGEPLPPVTSKEIVTSISTRKAADPNSIGNRVLKELLRVALESWSGYSMPCSDSSIFLDDERPWTL